MSLYAIDEKGLELNIYAQPGARRSEIVGLYDERIKVRVSSPPVDGKANVELRKFLAAFCGVSKSRVVLLQGEKSKNKKVLLKIDVDQVKEVIGKLMKTINLIGED